MFHPAMKEDVLGSVRFRYPAALSGKPEDSAALSARRSHLLSLVNRLRSVCARFGETGDPSSPVRATLTAEERGEELLLRISLPGKTLVLRETWRGEAHLTSFSAEGGETDGFS